MQQNQKPSEESSKSRNFQDSHLLTDPQIGISATAATAIMSYTATNDDSNRALIKPSFS